ncbi:hypothetical protein [Halobacillus massiliensis]|uniref:hypothetical protein n=1 Tax=Halobacillus massiliensis TaxID=1926286 RepID=UPI0015C4AD9B|nr:hypothetical protein [Halobacillus massiliensis]
MLVIPIIDTLIENNKLAKIKEQARKQRLFFYFFQRLNLKIEVVYHVKMKD